ncbi:MAG: hypothetical protein WDW38_008045 [Sanguina aurantia]
MRLLLSTLLLLPLASAYSWQSLASLLSSPTTNLKGLAWKATHTTAGTAAVPLHLEEILTAAASLPNKASHGVLPVVLWHGMGDSCCDPHTTGAVKNYLQEQLGVYVHSIATGNSEQHDVLSSFFGDVNDQVAAVCAELRRIPELRNGFNAIGFSQGGQFMRAVVQRCQHTFEGKVVKLITLGAQHQGVSNVPGCATVRDTAATSTCFLMQELLGHGAYLPYVRDHVVQAQYFKDPDCLEEYRRSNPFLPDINNELLVKRQQYKDNLASLEQLVLFRFADDATVVPRDSAWFYFHDGKELLTLEEQAIYREDWIGLRTLDESHRLVLAEAPGAHMHFTMDWFEEHIVDKYLV